MRAVIQKWGNSQAIRLPKTILETAQLTENEPVRIFAERDKIIIEKDAARKHQTLAERLAGFKGEYVGEEWQTGATLGKEV